MSENQIFSRKTKDEKFAKVVSKLVYTVLSAIHDEKSTTPQDKDRYLDSMKPANVFKKIEACFVDKKDPYNRLVGSSRRMANSSNPLKKTIGMAGSVTTSILSYIGTAVTKPVTGRNFEKIFASNERGNIRKVFQDDLKKSRGRSNTNSTASISTLSSSSGHTERYLSSLSSRDSSLPVSRGVFV